VLVNTSTFATVDVGVAASSVVGDAEALARELGLLFTDHAACRRFHASPSNISKPRTPARK